MIVVSLAFMQLLDWIAGSFICLVTNLYLQNHKKRTRVKKYSINR